MIVHGTLLLATVPRRAPSSVQHAHTINTLCCYRVAQEIARPHGRRSRTARLDRPRSTGENNSGGKTSTALRRRVKKDHTNHNRCFEPASQGDSSSHSIGCKPPCSLQLRACPPRSALTHIFLHSNRRRLMELERQNGSLGGIFLEGYLTFHTGGFRSSFSLDNRVQVL